MINWGAFDMDHCVNDQYLSLVELATPAGDICTCQLQSIKVSFQVSLLHFNICSFRDFSVKGPIYQFQKVRYWIMSEIICVELGVKKNLYFYWWLNHIFYENQCMQ